MRAKLLVCNTMQDSVASNRKLVSVIVPAYKCERYIGACLESILGQTYPYIELIVIYVPSPDNTYSMLKNYKREIILLKQRKKTFPAIARNSGLRIAKGTYVAFCDADDYFESTKIESQIKMIEEKGADITCTDVILVDENENTIRQKTVPRVTEKTFSSWMRSPFTPTSSILMKRELVEKEGGFDENLDTAEDFDLLLRLIMQSRIIRKTPGFLTYCRVRSDSLSRTFRIRTDLNRIKIFKKYGLAKQILLDLLRLLRHLIVDLLIRPRKLVEELVYLFHKVDSNS